MAAARFEHVSWRHLSTTTVVLKTGFNKKKKKRLVQDLKLTFVDFWNLSTGGKAQSECLSRSK